MYADYLKIITRHGGFHDRFWYGEFKMILPGKMTRLKQQFIVVHTKNSKTTLQHLKNEEKKLIEKTAWFNIKEILTSEETVYSVVFPNIFQRL